MQCYCYSMATNHICAVCGKACENQRTGYWKKKCDYKHDPKNKYASPAGYISIPGIFIHLCNKCNAKRREELIKKEDVLPKCYRCGAVCENKLTGFHAEQGELPELGSWGGFIHLCKKCSKEHHNYHDPNPKPLREKYTAPKPKLIKKIRSNTSTCSILKQHAEVLADDPERLSTDFIKSLMHTEPKC